MKSKISRLFVVWALSLNLPVFANGENFISTKNTACDELVNFIRNTTKDNEKLYQLISSCDYAKLPAREIKEILSIQSTAVCVKSNLFQTTDSKCEEFAIKIGEKLKKDGLNFALLDEFYEQNFKTPQNNSYFIDLLRETNSYEILKFYLDNGTVVNENSRVLSMIGAEILIFVSQNCDGTKEAIKSKKPTPQILEFTKTEKYTNFRDKELKIASEILKHTNKKDFIAKSKGAFDDLIAITNDEKLEKFIQTEN